MCYVYVYLDNRKEGSYSYGQYHFEYEPFYVGKGKNDRYLTHLRIARGDRSGKNNLVISKIRSIINDGFEPIIIKLYENLSESDYSKYEIDAISEIGKICDGKGPLLNITDGGDGGITWIGEHHNKGKKYEEIVGLEKSMEMKKKLSEQASERVGELNANYGNRGDKNPIYGIKRSEETKDKIRKNTLEQFSKYTKEQIDQMVNLMNDARKNKPDEIKHEWYANISKALKEKSERGELFTEEHRKKLSNNHYKKNNKGSEVLKTSEETKIKISNRLKGRAFTLEHRDKLRKCISFEEFEVIIVDLVNNGVIKTITAYRKYAKDNPELKYTTRPEKSYKNCGWSGWRKYGL